jgi:tRNA (cmo5U34)-methyltransferase
MNHTLDYFSFQSAMYDLYQASCVPKYGEVTAVATNFLAHVLPENAPVAVLDLGCGTGNTTQKLREILPAAAITCLDGSEDMLAAAQTKLTAAGASDVRYCRADLAEHGWSENLVSDSYDAIVSVFVLEHLPFAEYRHCLSQAARILKPGGWFVTVEGYEGHFLQGLFLEEMAANEARFVRDGKMTQAHMDEMKALSASKEKHYFSTMRQKETWWLESGFSSVEFIWQYYCVAALVGQKKSHT